MSRARKVAVGPVLIAAVVLLLAACAGTPRNTATVRAPTVIPAGSHALFLGDSWTSGYGVASGESYAYRAAKTLGWRANIEGQPGSGYLARLTDTASTLPARARELRTDSTMDVVVLQGGINDAELKSLTGLPAAIDSTIRSLAAAYPDAPIVLLGPASYTGKSSDQLRQIDADLASAARRFRIAYISPLEEDWVSSVNVDAVIDPSNAHPTVTGHIYLAERFVNDIRLLEQAGDLTRPRV